MINRTRLVTVGLAALAVVSLPGSPRVEAQAGTQAPTFRSGVELVAVDVQVVDRSGNPILGLAPSAFEVTIDGRKRRVVSAELQKYAPSGIAGNVRLGDGPQARNEWPFTEQAGPGRTFVVVIDSGSFPAGETVGVLRAAQAFVDRLAPGDEVGVFTLPHGTALSPTADRPAVRQALGKIVGIQGLMTSRYNLSPAEVMDLNAWEGETQLQTLGGRGLPTPTLASQGDIIRQVQLRECRNTTDQGCLQSILMEADILGRQMEEQVTESVAGLNGLLRQLSDYPGRKTIILMSAGMPVSDRQGGWHSDGGEGRTLGHDAARAHTTVYAVHLDQGYRSVYSAEQRQSRPSVSRAREREVEQLLLNEFADASGGALISVATGSGEYALDRVLLETSAYYLLGVAPDMLDMDGKAHQLKVKVKAAPSTNATIRSRQYVLLEASR